MDEIKRLTPAQRARCNRLIRRLCANYDGGNCMPLDDGERTRTCERCGKPFAPGSNRQKYCPECGRSIRRKQKADSARRRRSVEH